MGTRSDNLLAGRCVLACLVDDATEHVARVMSRRYADWPHHFTGHSMAYLAMAEMEARDLSLNAAHDLLRPVLPLARKLYRVPLKREIVENERGDLAWGAESGPKSDLLQLIAATFVKQTTFVEEIAGARVLAPAIPICAKPHTERWPVIRRTTAGDVARVEVIGLFHVTETGHVLRMVKELIVDDD
ncbi:MAG TPA: hypothetical protein VLB83_01280 [Candidatus Paceibacterota bacterium]|nr:hypothetical protein [Candidatus Paceibacterota bacterium]